MMEDKRTEYVYLKVTPEDKKRLESLQDNYKLQLEVINETFQNEKKWIKQELLQMDDDVLQYRAVLVRIRDAYKEAQLEHANRIEKLWVDIQQGIPSFKEEVARITKELKPVTEQLKAVRDEVNNLPLYQIEQLMKIATMVSNMSDRELSMFQLLVDNFSPAKPKTDG